MAVLLAGGCQAGEDFPGVLAALGLVAAGELTGDDRRAQGTLGPVIGGFDARMIEEGIQPLPPSTQAVGHPFLVGIGSLPEDQSVGPLIEVLTNTGKLRRRQVDDLSIERKEKVARMAAEVLPEATVAHRLGDFVFTHHGVDLPGADPNLWLVIWSPDPGQDSRLQPQDVIPMGLVNGKVIQVQALKLVDMLPAHDHRLPHPEVHRASCLVLTRL